MDIRVEKEIFLSYDEKGRPVMPCFITYISNEKPILMHRYCREDYSDGYDDFVDIFSYDNGKTWTEPVLHYKGIDTPEGKIRYSESAGFFDPETEKLITITNKKLYPNDRLDVDLLWSVVFEEYDPKENRWSGEKPLDFNLPGGISVSFCHPIKTKNGRIIFPAQTYYTDESGKPVHYKNCWSPAGVIVNILGDYKEDGRIEWKLSELLYPDLEKTSRGFYEPTIIERKDGSFAMVMRGDNSMFPDKPGYKWVSFSYDQCETWTEAIPFGCDRGEPIESSSSGSVLFRSIKNEKIYWIGNLCIEGIRPNGNWPRTPLVIAEVEEERFVIKRDTIRIIDKKQPGEPEEVQLSNFRIYQDRETGEVVLFLSRYGERGVENDKWKLANYYRYRISIIDHKKE
ncbi:MAG: glycoside hydrolase [Candidatus Omnitrophica bacterium]|nr:glycoside hydrolase [Candidatus Omnitrophota bacterium]